jgi:hypothetical protein
MATAASVFNDTIERGLGFSKTAVKVQPDGDDGESNQMLL